jgi:hypothetical protein
LRRVWRAATTSHCVTPTRDERRLQCMRAETYRSKPCGVFSPKLRPA